MEIAYASCVGKISGKDYAFMVTNLFHTSIDDPSPIGVWAADLVPAPKAPEGHQFAGKDVWKMIENPEKKGMCFVRDRVQKADGDPDEFLIECDQEFNQQWRW